MNECCGQAITDMIVVAANHTHVGVTEWRYIMDEGLVKIALAIIALIAAAAITVKIVRKSKSNTTKSTQIGNDVKGDMAGRDINKK